MFTSRCATWARRWTLPSGWRAPRPSLEGCSSWGASSNRQPVLNVQKRRGFCPPASDVCQFLKEGSWPPAWIVDFPAKDVVGIRNNVYGAVLKDGRWAKLCPIDDRTRVEFKQALCYERGLWGLDKVDILAKAMVHEAIHLCRFIGGNKPAMTDKEPWEYLFCPGPDTEDLTNTCWGMQN